MGEMHAEGQERMGIFFRKAHENLAERGEIDAETLEKFKKIDAKMLKLQYDNDNLSYHLGRGNADDLQAKWGKAEE